MTCVTASTNAVGILYLDEAIRQHGEREYSFVNATSSAVMSSLRIRRALAFDDHFSAAGFQELRT